MTNENSIGDLADEDYTALADFRHALRQFLAFSEQAATTCGLTPQQHQALLAIAGRATVPSPWAMSPSG
jgi:hypothetical protein